MGLKAGMATVRGTSTCSLEQMSSLISMVGWLVVVRLHFGFKRRRIWVREELRWVHDNGSYIFQTKVENSTKMADQLPRYQVLLELERVPSPPSTAVSHNRALNALSDSRLTRFVR